MNHSEKAALIRNAANEKIKEIQADQTLSDTGKGQRIREIREKANSEIAELRAKSAGEREAQIESLRSQLFAIGHKVGATESEKTLASMSYRDALFRADGFDTPDAATRMLRRARATGDSLLARAIATVSHERGWHSVVDAYASESEGTAAALNELRELESPKGSQQKFQENMAFAGISEVSQERTARAAAHSGVN